MGWSCAGHWDFDTLEVEILFASVDLAKFPLLGDSGFFRGLCFAVVPL